MKLSDIGGLKIGDTVSYSYGNQSSVYTSTVIRETDSGGFWCCDDSGEAVLYPEVDYHFLKKVQA